MKTHIITLCFILINLNSLCALTDTVKYPIIGERCPEFLLSEVQQFHKNEVRLEDFKGKWLILDFWGEYCASCVASFPKMNRIHQKFSDNIEILMVGIPYKNPTTIKTLYEKQHQKFALEMPYVFDKKLAEHFGVKTYPHIVIVDPNGIVQYITLNITEENVQDIINKKPVNLTYKYNEFEIRPYDFYNREIPFLLDGNGGNEYLYRSIFARSSSSTPPVTQFQEQGRLEILGFSLANFYQYAYVGNIAGEFHINSDSALYGFFSPVPFFQANDTSLLIGDYTTKKNLFSYSVHISESFQQMVKMEQINLRDILKKDLELLFPYKVAFETHRMPYYKLHINPEQLTKLQSKSNVKYFEWYGGYMQGFKAKYMPLKGLMSFITSSSGYNRLIPLLTDLPQVYLDIELKSIFFDDRVKELLEMGIIITKEEKDMQVLVIRDK